MSTEPTTGQIEESLLRDAFNEDVEDHPGEARSQDQDLFSMFLALSEQDFSNKPLHHESLTEAPIEDRPQEALEFPEEDLFGHSADENDEDEDELFFEQVGEHSEDEAPGIDAFDMPDEVIEPRVDEDVDASADVSADVSAGDSAGDSASAKVEAEAEIAYAPDFVIHAEAARPRSRAEELLEQTSRPYGPGYTSRPSGAPKKDDAFVLKDEVEGPLDALLRDREALLDVIMKGKGLVSVARVMLITVVVCGAALGASVGMYRGGVQILFAGIKLPLVLLLTTAVCAPVYTALKMAMRERASLLEDFALVLSSLALSSVVAASLAPLLLLAIFNGYSYHTLTLLLVSICGLGGVCGFLFFTKGLRRQVVAAERMIYLVFLCVIGVVSMQVSWLMRPYLVRPQTDDVPFVRSLEGSFFEAVRTSADSARGIYDYESDLSANYHRYDRSSRSGSMSRRSVEPARALEGTRTRDVDAPVVTGRYDETIPAVAPTDVVAEPVEDVAAPTPEDAELLREGGEVKELLLEEEPGSAPEVSDVNDVNAAEEVSP